MDSEGGVATTPASLDRKFSQVFGPHVAGDEVRSVLLTPKPLHRPKFNQGFSIVIYGLDAFQCYVFGPVFVGQEDPPFGATVIMKRANDFLCDSHV
ncbi:unnamed protein product [Lactuca saligna]|uniref:Uncharacterized protein n=1 Tax=Lactuca saligna TaxID=75948 RepID=A0AA35Z185_LACSI|nr:unnamed protein product [Lactuca saligna]